MQEVFRNLDGNFWECRKGAKGARRFALAEARVPGASGPSSLQIAAGHSPWCLDLWLTSGQGLPPWIFLNKILISTPQHQPHSAAKVAGTSGQQALIHIRATTEFGFYHGHRAADPFVVALAVEEGSNTSGEKVIVVTEEQYAPGRPRIPHVCQHYDLKYLTVHQSFLFEGLSF